MSRQERQAETRKHLLEAAADVFAQRGFHGASVEEITDRAGYTRGAFYSNFADKDDLFLALVDQRLQRETTEVEAIWQRNREPAQVLEALRQRAAGRKRPNEAWLALLHEFWLYALRNPAVRPKLAERQRAERAAYARAITEHFATTGLLLPAPVEQLALIVQVLDSGIILEHSIDPVEVPEGAYFDALALLFEAGVALSRERGRTTEPPPSR